MKCFLFAGSECFCFLWAGALQIPDFRACVGGAYQVEVLEGVFGGFDFRYLV